MMKLTGGSNIEKAVGGLIHDHANTLDRMKYQLEKLDRWNKEYSKKTCFGKW